MESFISKVIIVNAEFLADLEQRSRTDLEEFTNPGLDTKVVTLPLRAEEIEELTPFIEPSLICPGSIVVKPSYTDQFVTVDSFSEDLVLRKFGLFGQLCIELGAKKVSVSSIEDVSLEASNGVDTSAGLEATTPVGQGKAEFKAKQSSLRDDVCTSIMNRVTEAQGGPPDLEAAEQLMRQYGLYKDSLFTEVLNIRRSKNKTTRHELSLDFSKDVKRVFDSSIQAKIKAMSKFYQGSVDFERTRMCVETKRTATKLSVVIEF